MATAAAAAVRWLKELQTNAEGELAPRRVRGDRGPVIAEAQGTPRNSRSGQRAALSYQLNPASGR